MLERQGETLGECWLFFGFRYLNGDFLFQEELEAMQREGVLTRLIVAASREGNQLPFNPSPRVVSQHDLADEPRRVQDRIVEHGHDVRRLLADHNAILYVCGYECAVLNCSVMAHPFF
jgi:sulfite reductase (NADPH) flavoprotein alpha-component